MPDDYLNRCLELASNVREFFDRPTAADWHRVEEELEVVFPESYKAFVSAFGSGYFGPFELWNPAGQGRFELSKSRLIETREMCVALEDMNVEVFPNKNGLIFIGDGTASNFFAVEPIDGVLQPHLVEVDLGGHQVTHTNLSIAEYHYLSYMKGIQEQPLTEDSFVVSFFRPYER